MGRLDVSSKDEEGALCDKWTRGGAEISLAQAKNLKDMVLSPEKRGLSWTFEFINVTPESEETINELGESMSAKIKNVSIHYGNIQPGSGECRLMWALVRYLPTTDVESVSLSNMHIDETNLTALKSWLGRAHNVQRLLLLNIRGIGMDRISVWNEIIASIFLKPSEINFGFLSIDYVERSDPLSLLLPEHLREHVRISNNEMACSLSEVSIAPDLRKIGVQVHGERVSQILQQFDLIPFIDSGARSLEELSVFGFCVGICTEYICKLLQSLKKYKKLKSLRLFNFELNFCVKKALLQFICARTVLTEIILEGRNFSCAIDESFAKKIADAMSKHQTSLYSLQVGPQYKSIMRPYEFRNKVFCQLLTRDDQKSNLALWPKVLHRLTLNTNDDCCRVSDVTYQILRHGEFVFA